jgi:hypothetical protein
MKKNLLQILSTVLLLTGLGAARALADPIPSLQEISFNVNGTFNDSYSTPNIFTAISGLNSSAFNTSTGLGTLTLTYNPGVAGPAFVDFFLDEEVGVPFYNEFGSTGGGSPAAGESWEIGDSFASSIYTDVENNTLTNTNMLPEGASNYLPGCTGACNGDAATALGSSFNLLAGDEETLTLTVSTSLPLSGFYLDQTNPNDASNGGNQSDVYFSLSASQTPVGKSGPPPPPPTVPEPSTWVMMLTGLGAGITQLRGRIRLKATSRFFAILVLAIAGLVMVRLTRAQVVSTVPLDPTNPAAPHTAYPGADIVLGATVNLGGSTDTFTYSWNFGDGSAATSATTITNPNDISARHIYAGTTTGKTWTAVVTVIDTNTKAQATGNYLVIWPDLTTEANKLKARVNVAIDLGLWYMHQSMYHPTSTTGYWDSCAAGYSFDCSGYGSLDATNVQAFEVNGHLATGPASDPYTSDVQEGMNQMFTYLTSSPVVSKSYTFNPATANFGCSDGTAPLSTGLCDGTATKVFYNPGATSCKSPPCSFSFDGNGNGKAIFALQYGYSWGYEDGQYADSIIASGTPNAVAKTGGSGVNGQTFKTIVQDIADAAAYCQYGGDDYDVAIGYQRGSEPYQGGGWWYNCEEGDDNSVSQWASIGLIGAYRGFGLTIPPIISDANNMWVTASQDLATADKPTIDDPADSSLYAYGAFGYNGALNYSDAWGPFAVTPSGMVQMSLDGIGRTTNTAFGDATTDPDQRFNNAETYYADNFCNSTTGAYDSAYYTPRNYTYGLFSFTKAMLLHNPKNSLTPITYLRTQTPGVFTTNSAVPPNTIDWYAALSPANGGSDPCDGVAQTLVGRQNAAGYWYGDNYSGAQYPYETGWSIIMLQRTVFVNCVNNLGGAGTANSGVNPARIDLTWTGIPNVTGYDVLRSTTNEGPYTQVGSTLTTAYSDRVGLSNGDTYYYVLQPVNSSGAEVCQSNQATITIPKGR